MIDFGCVLIPSDILASIVSAEETTGWLGGAALDDESLHVVTGAKIGEVGIECSFVSRLFSHYLFQGLQGRLSDDLIRWCKVDASFFDRFPAFRWTSTAELLLSIGLSEAQLVSGRVICIVQNGPKSSSIRSFVVRSRNAQTNLYRVETIVVPQISEPFKRLPLATVTPLQGKHVAIIGLGSGGGEIALNLACAGVNRFSFFDPDRLHEENYIRHILNGRDLGRTKLKGLKADFGNRNLNVNVDEYFYNILFFADEFRKTLSERRPDLIICATDSRDSRRLINLCGVKLGLPTIIAGTLNGGRIGEVLLVLPGVTSCYECIREQLGAVLEATDVEGQDTNPYLGGDPTDEPSSAQRFDVAFVAGIATRVALQVLDPTRYPSLPANYLVWGREANTEFGSPFDFALPLTVNFARMKKLTECIVCGREVELDGLDVEQKYGDILAGFDPVQKRDL